MVLRLKEREFDLDLNSTAPNVVYRVIMEDGTELEVTNPSEYPKAGKIAEVYEPVVKATILAPAIYIGTILELCQSRRGVQHGMDYLSEDRVEIRYTLPLAEIVFDFFDALKSRTRGMRAWTTSRPANNLLTWSRSTSCCTGSRSMRSLRSCIGIRPTRTA
jgi:translation elongation factor EF-4